MTQCLIWCWQISLHVSVSLRFMLFNFPGNSYSSAFFPITVKLISTLLSSPRIYVCVIQYGREKTQLIHSNLSLQNAWSLDLYCNCDWFWFTSCGHLILRLRFWTGWWAGNSSQVQGGGRQGTPRANLGDGVDEGDATNQEAPGISAQSWIVESFSSLL